MVGTEFAIAGAFPVCFSVHQALCSNRPLWVVSNFESMGRNRLRGNSPTHLTPSPKEITPPSSIYGDWDTETAMSRSRPGSLAIPRTSSPGARLPSLGEILSNTAPPPWTLSAFTAYLSQNHCLETLEFLVEADRYRKAYEDHFTNQEHDPQSEDESVYDTWQRIMQAYIMPYSPREVNLPAPVRDRLLQLECSESTVPQPTELEEAVSIVLELMTDSLLYPFLQSVVHPETHGQDVIGERKSRSRLRIPRDLIHSSAEEGSQSPKSSFLPLLLGRSSPVANRSNSGSGGSASGSGLGFEQMEVDLVADDSSNTTPGTEPMTPPTTPPTSDFTFTSPNNNLHRALTGNSWKRMGARLGLSRKHRASRHSQPANMPTSAAPEPLSSISSTRSGPASL